MLKAKRMLTDDISSCLLGAVDRASQTFGRAIIEAGAVIGNSTVRNPLVIARGAHSKDAYIGPFTSISQDVCITGSEVESSIILQDTVIDRIPARISAGCKRARRP